MTFQPDQPTVTLPFPRFSWTSTETARFQCSFDDFVRDIQECGYGTTGSWQRYKPDGSYTLSVRGSDANGNTGSPVSHSFRVGKFFEDLNDLLSFMRACSLACYLHELSLEYGKP